MTTSQMQNKYDIIANNIVSEEVEMFNEDGNGTHTPSVYEYVKHAINNDEGFLAWLFDDGDIESKYDLDEEQQEELDEFIEFCIPETPVDVDIEECWHDAREHKFFVKDVYGREYDVCWDAWDSCDEYFYEDVMRDMLSGDYHLSDNAVDKVLAEMHSSIENSPLVEDQKRFLEEERNMKEGVDFRFDDAGTMLTKHYDKDDNEFWM